MINEKKGRIFGLTAAIILVAILLTAVVTFNLTKKKKESLVSKEIGTKKEPSPPVKSFIPQIEDIQETEYLTEEPFEEEETPVVETRKALPEFKLKDLPLKEAASTKKKSSEEEILEAQEQEQQELNTQPSVKEMEIIKKKGLIIY